MNVFLTFASSSMRRSADRLVKQAKALEFYDAIYSCSELSLSLDFRVRHQDKLVEGTRGYGYWCWKPQIIYQTLEEMADDDILQYTDAGCHINPSGLARLMEYFELAQNSSKGILAFQVRDPAWPLPKPIFGALDLPDYQWAKGDLLDYFDVRDRADIVATQTIGAGIIFIRKCKESMEFVNRWRSVFETDFSLIDDSPSRSGNLPGFKEHRHDQAIFSILCKLGAIETISAYEYWYPSQSGVGPDWGALKHYPVHAKRDKDFGVLGNIRVFFSRVLAKVKRTLQ